MENNSNNVKNIWSRRNPFKKEEPKEIEEEVKEEEIVEEEVKEEVIKEARQRFGEAVLVIQDATVTVKDPIIKLDINIRNKGKGISRDTKLKILASPMLRPLTTPMISLGDLLPKDKKQSLVQFEMSKRFVDEYTNFSLLCTSEDSKTASLVCTCQTGRRPLTATELLEQKEEEARRKLGKTGSPEKKKKKKK